ncbi:MAG: cysteine dioxygenase [Phycisphaerales bacterium JB037]
MASDGIRFHSNLPDTARARLVERLGPFAELPTDRKAFADAFKAMDWQPEDIEPCCRYETGERVRVELARCEGWVVLALCWEDAVTPIHDHDESECGFTVLSGDLEETRYECVGDCLARPTLTRLLIPGDTVLSSRDAIHRLGTPRGCTGRAVSLHAYCPALDLENMHVFEVPTYAEASRD